ncbi:hypothetical protein [Paenibacillus sp. NPDC058177]|uniref:hypothetical protein n=1 Tax=Paenibacillus sp. NPDC058177 TaxID=3346369 RepID=UPI0036D8B593
MDYKKQRYFYNLYKKVRKSEVQLGITNPKINECPLFILIAKMLFGSGGCTLFLLTQQEDGEERRRKLGTVGVRRSIERSSEESSRLNYELLLDFRRYQG